MHPGTARRALLLLLAVLPVLFNPYASYPSEPIKVTVFRWAVFGILVLASMEKRGNLRLSGISLPSRQEMTLELAVAVYATALVLSTVFSLDRSLSFWGGNDKHGLLTWLAVWLFFGIVISASRDPAWVRGLVDAVLVSTVPVCLYALVQFAGLDPLDWVTDSVSEMTSTLGRSNYVGAYIAVVAPFALLRLREARGEGQRSSRTGPALALVALHVTVILLSQARAAWLALTVGTAVFAVVEGHRKPSRPRRRWLAAGLSVGVLVGALLTAVDLSSLGSSISQDAVTSFGAKRLQTVGSRWMIWRETLSLVPENPMLGYGPETFATIFHAPDSSFVDDPHNVLLEHLVTTGALGLGAFCLLVGAFARQVKHAVVSRREGNAAILAAIGGSATAYLVQALFNPDVIVLRLVFWLDLGLVAAFSRR